MIFLKGVDEYLEPEAVKKEEVEVPEVMVEVRVTPQFHGRIISHRRFTGLDLRPPTVGEIIRLWNWGVRRSEAPF